MPATRKRIGCSARVVLDSISPEGVRLTSLILRFPRIILAEFNTHRKGVARNSASSRAIPIQKMARMATEDPYIPIFTGKQKGMSGVDMSHDEGFQSAATQVWLRQRDFSVEAALLLDKIGVHKQDANRLLEPFLWHEVLLTATWDAWPNIFVQRSNTGAQPAFQEESDAIWDALAASRPQVQDDWHLPLVTQEDFDAIDELVATGVMDGRNPSMPLTRENARLKVSVAHCARVSYLNHEGQRDIRDDIRMFDEVLCAMRHPSPSEHVAKAAPASHMSGPFTGWRQLRHHTLMWGFWRVEESATNIEKVRWELMRNRPDREWPVLAPTGALSEY